MKRQKVGLTSQNMCNIRIEEVKKRDSKLKGRVTLGNQAEKCLINIDCNIYLYNNSEHF